MNKHTKLLVSVLFVVIVILAIGITRFYLNVSQNTGSSNDSTEIVRKLNVDDDGNRIFEDSSGMYGIVDSRDRIITAPEWIELDFAGSNTCIASMRVGGRLLTGCINYEGNIIIPFIYRNITKHETDEFTFYIAESDSDDSCTIYSENFTPCFLQSWNSAKVSDSELTLSRGSGVMLYTIGENGFNCKKAVFSGMAGRKTFTLNVTSRVLLSKLNFTDLEKIAATTGAYLEFAFSGDRSALEKEDIGSHAAFTGLFPDEAAVTKKSLNEITDTYVYSEKSENGIETYAVSVSVNADIDYRNSLGNPAALTGGYKAVIKFRDSSTGIHAVSGSFIETAPEYPPEVSDTPPEDSGIQDVPPTE